MLALQLSGLHLHVDIDSNDAGLHEAHTHQAPSHDDDHSGEVDVQLLEQFVGQWSKIVAQVCYVLPKNIHRSKMLQNHCYGEDFVYDERLQCNAGLTFELENN